MLCFYLIISIVIVDFIAEYAINFTDSHQNYYVLWVKGMTLQFDLIFFYNRKIIRNFARY